MTTPRHLRRPVRSGSRLVLAAVVAVTTVACGVAGAGPAERSTGRFEPSDTELVVRFRDASVPPQHHRSYELTVVGGEAHVVVDSYGDVLHDETVTIADDVWARFVSGLDEQVDDIGETETTADDCVGGTSMSVEITSADAEFEREVGDCGSPRNEEIADRLDRLLAPIEEAVHLEALTASG